MLLVYYVGSGKVTVIETSFSVLTLVIIPAVICNNTLATDTTHAWNYNVTHMY